MTRFTRVGAEAGAISLPPTSAPFAGGGGGGTNAAPPPLEALCAIAAGARTTRHATNSAAKSSLLLKVEGILFRTPTGLADGLALKELARLLSKVRPSGRGHQQLGSPVPRYRGLGVAWKLPDVSASVAKSFNAVSHEFGARAGCPADPGRAALAAVHPHERPRDQRDERERDGEHREVGDQRERAGHALLLLALQHLLVRQETAREAGLRRDLLRGNRLVLRQEDRHRDERVALLDAHRRLPASVHRNRLRRAVDARPDLLERIDDAAAALPGGDVHELGVVDRVPRVEADGGRDGALGAGLDLLQADLSALGTGVGQR